MNEIKRDKEIIQLFLLFLTSTGEIAHDPAYIYLVLDFTPVLVPGDATLAVELLFSAFWSFNVCIPASLTPVYKFLELVFDVRGAYKGRGKKKPTVSGKAEDLHLKVMEKVQSKARNISSPASSANDEINVET